MLDARQCAMRILVLTPWYYSEVAGVFVHQQVKALQAEGCGLRVVSPAPWTPILLGRLSRKWALYAGLPSNRVVDGLQVCYPHYLSFPKSICEATSGRRMFRGIRATVDSVYREFPFDVIHAHVALPHGFAAVMLKRRYDVPVVITVHGQDLQVTVNRSGGCRKALRQAFSEADRVVTVSSKLMRLAETHFSLGDRLFVIGNGVNPADTSPVDDALASRYAGSRIILSVGHLIKSKGVDLNLRAISQLSKKHPDLRYLVIGDGPERSSLKRLVRGLGIGNRVEFLGEMPHREVMMYMAIAEVFSLPSWLEGFGVVYIEAAMHGKPVIACQGEGIEDVFANGVSAMFVKPGDVESLAGAMDHLLENPRVAREMGRRAKDLVLGRYTWQGNAQRYVNVYRDVIRESSGQQARPLVSPQDPSCDCSLVDQERERS